MSRKAIEYWQSLSVMNQLQINWLISQRVPTSAICSAAHPCLKRSTDGIVLLIEDEAGPIDCATWSLRDGGVITLLTGAGFALGEGQIHNPGVYAFDGCLQLYDNPLSWLRSNRDGVVVIDWNRAFDRLRDCPRISVCPSMRETYRQSIKPRHMPELFVRLEDRSIAA